MSSVISYTNAKTYKIKYETPSGEQKTIELKGINYPEFNYESRHAILPIDVTSGSGVYGYQLNPDTYYLAVKVVFVQRKLLLRKAEEVFSGYEKPKTKNLILDIRDNSGGSISNVPLLYSFLSKDKLFNNSYKYGTKVVDINYKGLSGRSSDGSDISLIVISVMRITLCIKDLTNPIKVIIISGIRD